QLQRVQRADPAAGPFRPGPVRGAVERSRAELPANPVGHGARCGDPVPLWRQAASDPDQPQPQAVAGEGALVFVQSAISGVIREAVIAASLTALMILLFLGSWRSTLIIAVSIPLSVLASIAILSALGETINLMT